METITVSIINKSSQEKYIPQYLSYEDDRVHGCDYNTNLLRWIIIGSSPEQYNQKVLCLQEEMDQYNRAVKKLWSTPGFSELFEKCRRCIPLTEIENKLGTECMHVARAIKSPRQCYPDLMSGNGFFLSNSAKIVAEFSIDDQSYELDIQNSLIDIFKQGKYYCAYSWEDDRRDYYFSLACHFEEQGLLKNVMDNFLLHLEMEWQDGIGDAKEQKAILYIINLLKARGYLREFILKPSDYLWLWNAYTKKEDETVSFYLLSQKYLRDKLLCERINCLLSNLYVYDDDGELDPNAPLYDAELEGPNLDIPFYFLQDKNDKMYISRTPGQFGGHKKLKIYGRMNCPSANRYIQKGQYVQHRVFFADQETAIAAGYRPCGVCMKEEYKKWKAAQDEIYI